MLVPTRIRFGITLPAGRGPRVGAGTPARSTLSAVIDGNGLNNQDTFLDVSEACVYGRPRQMCGVEGGAGPGSSISARLNRIPRTPLSEAASSTARRGEFHSVRSWSRQR